MNPAPPVTKIVMSLESRSWFVEFIEFIGLVEFVGFVGFKKTVETPKPRIKIFVCWVRGIEIRS